MRHITRSEGTLKPEPPHIEMRCTWCQRLQEEKCWCRKEAIGAVVFGIVVIVVEAIVFLFVGAT